MSAGIRLYDCWEEARFLKRLNRFVMQLENQSEVFNAYVANTGRMEEFQVPGSPFFITRGNSGKYDARIVGTFYQDSYVLLDTIKYNRIVEWILNDRIIPEFRDVSSIEREVSLGSSRLDFLLNRSSKRPAVLEVKSCTLCHKGVAMFPDAPTQRGLRHLQELERLSRQDYDTYTLYLISHKKARCFLPNRHTHLQYCRQFHRSPNITFLAYRLNMVDPVTVDVEGFKKIPIPFNLSQSHCFDSGSYVLVLNCQEEFKEIIGSLGEVLFKTGYYVYVGSAKRGLENRLKRHMRRRKKKHWHLDLVYPFRMKLEKAYRIRTTKAIEVPLAQKFYRSAPDMIPGFGSSDSPAASHLFYYPENPRHRRDFLDILLDFQTDF